MYNILYNKGELEITVPVNKYLPIAWFLIIAFFASVIAMLIIIIVMIKNLNFDITRVLGHIIFCIVLLLYITWLLTGKERIIIKKDSIQIIKQSKLFSIKKNLSKQKIFIITAKNVSDNESFFDKKKRDLWEMIQAIPFWKKMGQINIKYNGNDISILNGLEKHEIKEVIDILKKHLNIT
ncbi:MAG: hypothetical protein H0X62_06170 [Bacteroidetes bacterium]|nr:hypothetical protein [Bacteroidota bacterium]